MTEKINENTYEEYSMKKAALYSFAGFSAVSISNLFNFLIFTFYFAVVGLNVNYITIGFIIWSIWNAINDPFLGALSDKTTTKWGRRKPFIIAGIYPLLIINLLLWMPPIGASQFTIFLYFLIIIILWEFFFTMYSLNQTSLFPEMFRDHVERTKANTIVQFFQLLALYVAFLLPSFFIPQYDNPRYFTNYLYAAIAVSIICAITVTIFIKFGIKERVEFSKDPEQAPSFFNSFKYSLKNKAFRAYVIANFTIWIAFSMIPIITPLYGSFVLGIKDSLILSLFLVLVFISATIFIFIWQPVVKKFGPKKTFQVVFIVFIITLIPFMFISDMISAFFAYFCLGIGIAGTFTVQNVCTSQIIDDDELKNGIRREAGFYGIEAFMVKLSTVLVFILIALVFNSVGWAIYDPVGTTEETIFGLRALMVIFPCIFLIIGLISIHFYPFTKEKYEELTEAIMKLHESKREKVLSK